MKLLHYGSTVMCSDMPCHGHLIWDCVPFLHSSVESITYPSGALVSSSINKDDNVFFAGPTAWWESIWFIEGLKISSNKSSNRMCHLKVQISLQWLKFHLLAVQPWANGLHFLILNNLIYKMQLVIVPIS